MDWLNALDSFMWGKYMMVALFVTGIVLTIRLRGVQFRKLGYALKLAFTGASFKSKAEGEGDITPFQALMTTLASTVGNGNIAGVATAIALGGPGAPLWMWITALFGMATRGTEAMLGVKYRHKADDGTMIGGAFYYLEDGASEYIGKGLGKVLAIAFASRRHDRRLRHRQHGAVQQRGAVGDHPFPHQDVTHREHDDRGRSGGSDGRRHPGRGQAARRGGRMVRALHGRSFISAAGCS